MMNSNGKVWHVLFLMSKKNAKWLFYILSAKSVSRFSHFACSYPFFISICWKKNNLIHFYFLFPYYSWVNLEDSFWHAIFFSYISNIDFGSLKLSSNALKWVNFKLSFNMSHILSFSSMEALEIAFQYW